jgi:hypothetical protein
VNANDFREDLKPTRGQHEQIARELARLACEPYPATRVEATEFLLRLKTAPTPDPAAEDPAAAPRPLHADEARGETAPATASRVRVRDRGPGAAR